MFKNIAVVVLVMLIVGGFIYQQKTITDLSKSLGAVSTQLETSTKNVEKLDESIKRVEKTQEEYSAKISDVDKNTRENKTQLDKLKDREKTLVAKPTLTEKMINESFRAAADELSCSTGATERCIKK